MALPASGPLRKQLSLEIFKIKNICENMTNIFSNESEYTLLFSKYSSVQFKKKKISSGNLSEQ